jgi:hypothetical protein
MRITTDSWDTPGLTGTAALMVEAAFWGGALGTLAYPWAATNAASPDVACGLRFNLNRPVSGAAQAQEYCKGLYTLAVALGEDTTKAAQWAVNVLDFRDDSKMTAFEYDTNLTNGWNVDGDPATTSDPDRGVVWGVEKPELVIVETAAWRDTINNKAQLFVNVHRPAAEAVLVTSTSGTITVTGTTERSTLTSSGTLSLNGWQLRFGTNNAVAFANVGVAGVTAAQSVVTGTAVTSRSTNLSGASLGAPAGFGASGSNAYLCVRPVSPLYFSASGTSGIPTFTVDQGNPFQFPVTSTSGTVFLERLADPSQPNTATNPYIVVDTAALNLIPDINTTPPASLTKNRRKGPADTPSQPLSVFWNQAWVASGTALTTYSISGTNPVAWFHWPNRPFISQAELALVPSDSAENLLKNYSFPTTSLAAQTGSLLLDATHVPSRFAGCAISLANPSSGTNCGLHLLNANHFSTWREPGRVNVNTTPTGTASVVDIDSLVWSTLIGGTSLPLTTGTAVTVNPFVARAANPPSPATSMAHLLSLSGSAGQPVATGTLASGAASGSREKNPFFAYATAIRLANTATVRSNVFAVWITVEVTDTSANAPSPTYRRLFAIIDRSLPVGYNRGEDLNVRDTIRLQRYLD